MLQRASLASWLVVATFAAGSMAVAQRADAPERSDSAANWWAYQPLLRPAVPDVTKRGDDGGWVRSPIDAFVLSGLRDRGLTPAPAADRHTLLRRVTYDLTGLPPTQQQIDEFVSDASAEAYQKVVDRLLASPQYGVKWAQHWLDLVRYAETDGYERDSKKPFVWRYRDWVVAALNADMTYGDFLVKQLAGDELPDARVQDHVATGFYRLGIWDDEPTDREQHLYDAYDGMADTTARATLAISMGCARCHDHKKDPLPTKDYYAFLGHFENVAPYDKRAQKLPVDGGKERFERAMATFERAERECREQIQDFLGRAPAGADADADADDNDSRRAVAFYAGDRASPKVLFDHVGKSDGSVHGHVVQVDGLVGKALRFDGDDHCRIPRIVEGSFTVSFFVRSDQPGRGQDRDRRWFLGSGLVDGEVPGVVDDWGIAWLGNGVIAAGTGRPETIVSTDPGYHDGAWHHVAFARSQELGRISLYVDGRLAATKAATKAPLTSPDDLVIGRSRPGKDASNAGGFRGDIDELSFYRCELSAAEVMALAFRAPKGAAGGVALAELPAARRWRDLSRPRLQTVSVLAVRERDREGRSPVVRVRGNVHARGAEVALGVPSMLGASSEQLQRPAPTAVSTGRRLALANWIVRPDNRLTWRVLANRLWQHHFGRGIVRSSNDFGRLGALPTHPKLLDWLACEVVSSGQRWKAMHRLIVMSSTYRMSSQASARELAQDPQNDAFWRFNRRRLTAEEVRDSILAVNGTVNLALGGPSVFPPLPAAVLQTASRPDAAWGRSTPEQAARRSLFVHVKRSLPEPLLAAFDRADTDSSCPVRFATVQPTQALTMVNGDFANLQAQRLAERLQQEAKGLRAQLRRGLELCSQRPPRDADEARLFVLACDLQREFGRSESEALQRCCLVLLNCNEFLFVD
ncbi:MAG: DUF1553 domain-containing protein [Planctomycetota bacterium]